MKTIEMLRADIDNIDTQLVSLLNQRYNACLEIGKLKQNNSIVVLDSNREKNIIDRLNLIAEYPGMVNTIWPVIMAFSRNLQSGLGK
jgi:chorismate mutase